MIVAILREPREKIWGVLSKINTTGVFMRGIDLNAFEEFQRSVRIEEDFYGLSEHFFPLWRVEKISKDEKNGAIPSLHEQFKQMTGLSLKEL